MTRLAILCNLDSLIALMEEYTEQRGNRDDCQLLRQLALSDFVEWVNQQQREEIANGKTNRTGSAHHCAVPRPAGR